jgi:hypothetical protein
MEAAGGGKRRQGLLRGESDFSVRFTKLFSVESRATSAKLHTPKNKPQLANLPTLFKSSVLLESTVGPVTATTTPS